LTPTGFFGPSIGGPKPAAFDASERDGRGLVFACRIAGAEERPNGRADVALEARLREPKVLAIKQLIILLRRRRLVGRIDRPIRQRNDRLSRKTLRDQNRQDGLGINTRLETAAARTEEQSAHQS
jgi:hypothetical protein